MDECTTTYFVWNDPDRSMVDIRQMVNVRGHWMQSYKCSREKIEKVIKINLTKYGLGLYLFLQTDLAEV